MLAQNLFRKIVTMPRNENNKIQFVYWVLTICFVVCFVVAQNLS